MPRKGETPVRIPPPDPVLHSRLVAKFINYLMLGGKKTAAERAFYGALQLIHERTGQNPVDILQRALQNVTPELEVRPRRVGGATYQVPMEVSARRRLILPLRWLTIAARKRSERTMAERLAAELLEASNREGVAMRRREEVHRMAEANKAYAHYRL